MRLAKWVQDKFDILLTTPTPPGKEVDDVELEASSMIPYRFHYDDETAVTKEDGLIQVIKFDGLYFESLTEAQIKGFERRRNTILRSIANSNRGVYVHLVRRKATTFPGGQFKNWFARYLNEQLRSKYQKKSSYVNDIYFTIIRNRFRQGAAGWIDRLIANVSHILFGSDYQKAETFSDQERDIYEASNLVLKTMADYGPRRLRIFRTEEEGTEGGQDFSEIAQFLNYLVNLEDRPILVDEQPLDKTLATSRINGGRNAIEIVGLGSHRRLAAVLSMAQWPSRTPSRLLDDFLRVDAEFIITQSFFFLDRLAAEGDMKMHRRRAEQANDVATDQTEDIKEGLKELGSGRAVNGKHHLSIMVHVGSDPMDIERSIERLNHALDEVKKAFVPMGVKPVREAFGAETFYWSQLPGQDQSLMGRRGKINSKNFAGFASLHNFAKGKLDGNLWGSAITQFETISGTQYFFNFHREVEGMVAGHTSFSADTGAGKTTLLSALVAQADKAEPSVYWFDNRKGAMVFMRAMGGQHTILTVNQSTGWNPCKLPDNQANRAYLVDLMSMMRTCYTGGTCSPSEIKSFQKAVEENYSLPFENRRLRNIAWCFGIELKEVMELWYGDGPNAGAFDNEDDNIDLTRCRHYCYEMEQLIKDGEARPELPIILSYPFHRIEQAMNGSPFIIVLEEGQNLVKHDYWKTKIDAYIMQIRRKNGLLIFVTPDPKFLYCETDSIEKQTVTKIYLPNSNAKERDYVKELGLTRKEFEFIRDTPVEARQFLIRRGKESIRAVFDLDDIRHVIPVLSSNDKSVALMNEVCTELNTQDPERWVPLFIQRAQQKNTHNLKKVESV
ncbi:hypothetical protein [Chromobacterium vaccinii]|uniref:VirB4 family type IV secretion/conjugal transfer ATPase n=1 Tax=Chromobacterium vaccinii TaxID=1108595 RepID=UPI00345A2B3B